MNKLDAYLEAQRAEKAAKKEVEKLRDEILKDLHAGKEVGTKEQFAAIQTATTTTFRVRELLAVLREFKLDNSKYVKAVTAEVKRLPENILAKLPYVDSTTEKLVVKRR